MAGREISSLRYPWIRNELVGHLRELATPNPRPTWKADIQAGLNAGIDEVIHFFFDDHDFDEGDIGVVLSNQQEVELVGDLKRSLNSLVNVLPQGNDDEYVSHPDWPSVTRAASRALEGLQAA